MPRKYGKSAQTEVKKEMRRFKKGTAKSGKGGKVKSRKQAIAIALSIARKKGDKVPKKPAKSTRATKSRKPKAKTTKAKSSRKTKSTRRAKSTKSRKTRKAA